jgi:Zn-finger nucleic acid-binding protein
MFKKFMALLLFISAIFVFYPQFKALDAVNTVSNYGINVDTSVIGIQMFGYLLLYVFAFGVLAWLPDKATVKVQDLVSLQDCPNCGEESLNKVRLNVNDSTNLKPRISLGIEYCTNCKKIWVDGGEIIKGGLYDYIENSLISVYGNEAPMEKNETFNPQDFDELLSDVVKAKKAKSK